MAKRKTPLDVESPEEDETSSGAFSYEKDSKTIPLSGIDEDWVVGKISKRFDALSRGRKKVEQRWKKTEEAVLGVVSTIQTDRFNALVPFGKQTLQTLLSHFWSRSLSTDDILFSIHGRDDESEANAPVQKQNLLDILKKDNFTQKMDDAAYSMIMKGVVVGYVSYVERKRQIQVLAGHKGTDKEVDAEGKPVFVDLDETVQDSGSLCLVDPHQFVFDNSAESNQWDSCFKAYQSFWVYEDIKADPNFHNYEGLNELNKSKATTSDLIFPKGTSNQKRNEEGFDENGRIELIEFHGDFRMEDGSYLRNWTIVIAARKRLIRFERNAYKINPFVKWTYDHSEDGWGYSPIDFIVPLINAASTLINSGVEAAKMAINPPMMAPKGMLPQKRIYLVEGRVIEYEQNMAMPTLMPQPIPLNYQTPFPYLELFETQSETTTGATRQLSGSVTSNDKDQTATEFQGLQIVGNLLLDRVIDLFNHYFKIPVIEKIALITAMFNPKESQVRVTNEKGLTEFKKVDSSVYYGDYEYVIDDNKSELERKQNLQEKIHLLQLMMQDPELGTRMKKMDIASELWRDFGYGQAANYFMNDEEFVEHTVKEIGVGEQIKMLAAQLQAVMQQQAMAGGMPPPMPQPGGPMNAPNQSNPSQQGVGAGNQPPPSAGPPPGNPGMAGVQGIPG